jgi:hypothetical protein
MSPCLLCNSGVLHQPPSVEQACRRALGYGCCQLCYLWHRVVWRASSGQVQRQRSTSVPCTVLSIAVNSELAVCYVVAALAMLTAIPVPYQLFFSFMMFYLIYFGLLTLGVGAWILLLYAKDFGVHTLTILAAVGICASGETSTAPPWSC